MNKYPVEIEQQMQFFFSSLPEHQRRRYAALEAQKLGHGGKRYICELLKCNFRTLEHGLNELQNTETIETGRIRKPGAGRQFYIEQYPEINDAFLKVIEKNTAGSPMDEKIKWTNLSRNQLAEGLKVQGFDVSVTVVDQLLKKHDFRRRKAVKTVAGGKTKNRDEQFKNIGRLKNEYHENSNPVISMDTKKKS